MSTYFKSLPPIQFKQLFDGRLQQFGIVEDKSGIDDEPKNCDCSCLTDGKKNWLWVYDNNGVCDFAHYFPNGDPTHILDSIAEAFNVRIASEYEPEYHGFATKEEWDACEEFR